MGDIEAKIKKIGKLIKKPMIVLLEVSEDGRVEIKDMTLSKGLLSGTAEGEEEVSEYIG